MVEEVLRKCPRSLPPGVGSDSELPVKSGRHLGSEREDCPSWGQRDESPRHNEPELRG